MSPEINQEVEGLSPEKKEIPSFSVRVDYSYTGYYGEVIPGFEDLHSDSFELVEPPYKAHVLSCAIETPFDNFIFEVKIREEMKSVLAKIKEYCEERAALGQVEKELVGARYERDVAAERMRRTGESPKEGLYAKVTTLEAKKGLLARNVAQLRSELEKYRIK